jgi:antirestriction protein
MPVMKEETKELLENVMDEDLALEFLKEYDEDQFVEYYEQYETLVSDYGQGLVDEYIEYYFLDAIDHFEDAYQGEYESGAEFAEQMVSDMGYVNNNIPSWVEIDWQSTWDNLSDDYAEIVNPDSNRVAIFSNSY